MMLNNKKRKDFSLRPTTWPWQRRDKKRINKDEFTQRFKKNKIYFD